MPQSDEAAFRRWYVDQVQKAKQRGDVLNPDPDDPAQFYDYRAAFRAGAEPDAATHHWPSDFKRAGHPNEIVGGFNTRTGERVPGTPRASEAELVGLGWEPATAKRLAATKDDQMAQQKWWQEPGAALSKDEAAAKWWEDVAPAPVELPDPPPGSRRADYRPARIEGRGTTAQALSTPEQARFAARVTPAVASGMAALMTEGVSLPIQAGIQALIGGAGGVAQSGTEGGDLEDMAARGVLGAGAGAGSTYLGAGVGAAGKYLKAKGTPIRIMGGGFEKAEEVPTGVLDPAGKMTTRTVMSKTPEWTKEIPPDLSGIREYGNAAADAFGMADPVTGFAIRSATRAASNPTILRGMGSMMKSAFAPGIPMSVSALLALLNQRNAPTK